MFERGICFAERVFARNTLAVESGELVLLVFVLLLGTKQECGCRDECDSEDEDDDDDDGLHCVLFLSFCCAEYQVRQKR